MKIYTVFNAKDKDKFHAWALAGGLSTHYRSMANGNFLASGNIRHEKELTEMGFSLLPPLEEPETTINGKAVAMFPAELGILATHNTYQAMKVYSEKTGTKTFHPRR